MLKKQNRLTREKDFRRVKRRGKSRRSAYFWLNWLPNDLPRSRFGFIATKKMGLAVERNRAVRLLREVVRLNLSQIKKGVDVVFVVQSRLKGKKYAEVEERVVEAFKRAGLWVSG